MIINHITTALALAVSAFVLATADSAFAVGQISYGGCVSPDGSSGLCASTGNVTAADSLGNRGPTATAPVEVVKKKAKKKRKSHR
jgi:hypothetical protein